MQNGQPVSPESTKTLAQVLSFSPSNQNEESVDQFGVRINLDEGRFVHIDLSRGMASIDLYHQLSSHFEGCEIDTVLRKIASIVKDALRQPEPIDKLLV